MALISIQAVFRSHIFSYRPALMIQFSSRGAFVYYLRTILFSERTAEGKPTSTFFSISGAVTLPRRRKWPPLPSHYRPENYPRTSRMLIGQWP